MPAINLLPKDLVPREGVLKTVAVLRKALVIGFVGLIILIISLIAVFFVLVRRYDDSLDRQKELKKQISALEQTEKKLVLVKDRLEKANQVLALDSAEPEVASLDSLLDILPDGVFVETASLKSDHSEMTLSAPNSSSLAEFFARLLSAGIYQRIELLSLDYSAAIKYTIVFKLAT